VSAAVSLAGAAGTDVVTEGLVHIYRRRGVEVVALRGVDLTVPRGEAMALLGPSGSGKSTLLALLAGLVRPAAGRVVVAGRDLGALTERALLEVRRTQVGVLLQGPARNLLPYATVGENLAFVQRGRAGRGAAGRRRREELLAAVGLDGRQRDRARTLSGGEQQRLALAVAVAQAPRVLLADEPTSQLDAVSAATVTDLLLGARERDGTTVVVVTHDERLADRLDRSVAIRGGRVGAERHGGRTHAVVGADGSVQLPAEVAADFPPGTLVRVERTARGVELVPEERP